MDIIKDAIEFARQIFAGDTGGHDFYHTLRVYHLATAIAREENADLEIVQLAALLHDIDDHKISPQTCEDKGRALAFLKSHGVPCEKITQIVQIISSVSFSRNLGRPDSLEAMCVQDADRLDALGALGIARAFAYGGSHGRKIFDPSGLDKTTTIDHFYDKLLKLKELMNTRTGQKMAANRDRFTRSFLNEFFAEWEGSR
jgi:uncharacterized protein